MTLRSTGTDGVLFVENSEKSDGFRIVRFNFGMTVGAAMPTVDINFDVLSRQFGMESRRRGDEGEDQGFVALAVSA